MIIIKALNTATQKRTRNPGQHVNRAREHATKAKHPSGCGRSGVPFSLPLCTPAQEQKIRVFGEQLDAHRALNAERAAEEKKGLIRWLRPDLQNPSGIKPDTQAPLLPTGEDDEAQEAPAPAVIKPWPKKIAEQIAAVRDRVAFPGKLFTVESVAAAFKGAKKKDIEGFLDGFAALGVLTTFEGEGGKRWRAAGKAT